MNSLKIAHHLTFFLTLLSSAGLLWGDVVKVAPLLPKKPDSMFRSHYSKKKKSAKVLKKKRVEEVDMVQSSKTGVGELQKVVNSLLLEVSRSAPYIEKGGKSVKVDTPVSIGEIIEKEFAISNISYEPETLKDIEIPKGSQFKGLDGFAKLLIDKFGLFLRFRNGRFVVSDKTEITFDISDIIPYVNDLNQIIPVGVEPIHYYDLSGLLVVRTNYDGLKTMEHIFNKLRKTFDYYEYPFSIIGTDVNDKYYKRPVYYVEGTITSITPITLPEKGELSMKPARDKVLFKFVLPAKPYPVMIFTLPKSGGQKEFAASGKKFLIKVGENYLKDKDNSYRFQQQQQKNSWSWDDDTED